jgi:hypothetical protein
LGLIQEDSPVGQGRDDDTIKRCWKPSFPDCRDLLVKIRDRTFFLTSLLKRLPRAKKIAFEPLVQELQSHGVRLI